MWFFFAPMEKPQPHIHNIVLILNLVRAEKTELRFGKREKRAFFTTFRFSRFLAHLVWENVQNVQHGHHKDSLKMLNYGKLYMGQRVPENWQALTHISKFII